MTTTPSNSSHSIALFKWLRQCSSRSMLLLKQVVYRKRISDYLSTPEQYRANIIGNIIYNEKSHVVAQFKDFLIIDDNSEFLKRFYKRKESQIRLPKFCEYYETYSKIYPNYTNWNEGQYIYLNIQRKQRMIDLQERMDFDAKNRDELLSGRSDNKKSNHKKKRNYSDEVFSTDVYESILNEPNNEVLEIIFGVNLNTRQNDDDDCMSKINDFIDLISKVDVSQDQESDKKNDDFTVTRFMQSKSNSSHNIRMNNGSNKDIAMKFSENGRNVCSNLWVNLQENRNSSKSVNLKNILCKIGKNIYLNKHDKKPSENRENNNNNYNNNYINPKIERSLIKRLEYHWLKKSEKEILKHGGNSELSRCSADKDKDGRESNNNYNKKSSNKNKMNSNNNFNKIPLTYRVNRSTVINNVHYSKITDIANSTKSPSTERGKQTPNPAQQNNNQTANDSTSRKKSNPTDNNNNTNNNNSIKGNKDPVVVKSTGTASTSQAPNTNAKNTGKYTNNIIYIINQNPKFTTHVTYYSNNINNNNSRKTSSQPPRNRRSSSKVIPINNIGSITNSITISQASSQSKKKNNPNIMNSSYKSNIQTKLVNSSLANSINNQILSQEKPKVSITNANHNRIFGNSNYIQNKIKRRNASTIANSSSSVNNSKYNNNTFLQTARDIGYKEINIWRNSSQMSMVSDHNQKSTKEPNVISRNKRMDKSATRTNIINNNSISNKYTKNDSISKFGIMNSVNMNKKIIQGIQIKNFSKVFGINISKPPKTDRPDK